MQRTDFLCRHIDFDNRGGDAGPMVARKDIIIIGAGLAGLAAAYRLKTGYRLLERGALPGGLSDTTDDRGFRFDRTGHLLHLREPRIRRTILGLLDEEPLRLERNSRIFSQGVYTHYPFQANTFGLPKAVVADCLKGFIEAYANGNEPASRVTINTFEDFIFHHFGRGIARHFMIPYNSKIWGIHPRQITAKWCQRFVPLPNLDEVIDGALGPPTENLGYNAQFIYPRTGIGELASALARRIEQNSEYRCAPTAIDYKAKRLRLKGKWLDYRAMLSTMPLDSLLGLMTALPKFIQKSAARLRCSSLRYLDVALNIPARNDYHWTYVPERKYPFYRVGCYSNFSPAMAPPKKSNLYVELTSRRPFNADKHLPRVVQGLVEMGIIGRPSDILFVKPRLLRHAYVIYDAHHDQAVSTILSWLEKQCIFTAGRYARWQYASMEDALNEGFAAADKIRNLDNDR